MVNDNWCIELLASTPFSHTAVAAGTLLSLAIGAGGNDTVVFDEDTTSAADATFATLGLTGR